MQGTWTDYGLRWIVIIGLAFLAALALIGLGIKIDFSSLAKQFQNFGTFLLIVPFFLGFGWSLPRYAHLIAIPIDFALSAVQFAFAVTVLAPLSYISAALSSTFLLIFEAFRSHFLCI